ncbi:MAG: TonB-dependent receptor [Acidobacteriota bacterium]|nr:TonB-dependent receptor [Acidobacteriota bacterium]
MKTVMRALFGVLTRLLVWAVYAWSSVAVAQPAITVSGVVLDGVTNNPIADVRVTSGQRAVTTGLAGRFAIAVAARVYELRFEAEGYLETVAPLTGTDVEVRLFPRAFAETVEVISKAIESAGPSSTPVTPEQVFRAPGSIDNVFRTLDTLPGVASTDDFGSRLAVRGGTPDQNLTIMDGVEVHNPYRLFGIASAFNPDTVENFQLTAGGFGAAYGDRLSSLLVVDNRPGRSEFQGSTAASVTDANVVVEGRTPLGPEGTWLVSARRTYYDLVAGPLIDQDFPAFADVQIRAGWESEAGYQLTLTGLGSTESANLDFGDRRDQSEERAALGSDIVNGLASARLDASLSSRGTSTTIISWYRNSERIDFDGLLQNGARSNAPDDAGAFGLSPIVFDRLISVKDISLRQDVDYRVSERHLMSLGIELHRLKTNVGLSITGDRNPTEANGSSIQGGAGLPDTLDSTLNGTRGGLWLQDIYTPSQRLSFEPGVRLDWSTINGGATLSPRLAGSYALGRGMRLRAAGGLYTQSPGYEKLSQSDYFIDLSSTRELGLRHEKATHLVVGVEQELPGDLSARVEGYYKRFHDLLVGRLETEEERLIRIARYDFPVSLRSSVPTAAQIRSDPTNDAGGDAYGLDLFLMHNNAAAPLTGWLSYAWGYANRQSYGRGYAFEYDRRHAFNAVGRYRLTSRWDIAATARLASGFPHTAPVGLRVSAIEDARGRLVPATDSTGHLLYAVDYGGVENLNGAQLPYYARVDVRATYQRGGPSGRWSLYVEVINLLGRDNAVTLEPRLGHNPGSSVPRFWEEPAQGFPRIPTFGLRVRF